MSEQLLQFVQHHAILVSVFGLVLLAVIVNEYLTEQAGPKKLSPAAAVLEINHRSALVIDIRPKDAFAQQHILGALSVAADNLELFKRYQSSPFILVCARGLQSTTLANQLLKKGFTHVMLLEGGINAWQGANLPLVKSK